MQSARTPKRTVMVVEDDVIVRIVISDDLRAAGFEVIEAGGGTEALSLLDTGRVIDVIFSDVQMPGRIDGAALAEIVLRRFPATRLILTSGSTDGHDLAGVSQIPFIWKPYRPETVIAAVERVLEGRENEGGENGLSARG